MHIYVTDALRYFIQSFQNPYIYHFNSTSSTLSGIHRSCFIMHIYEITLSLIVFSVSVIYHENMRWKTPSFPTIEITLREKKIPEK